MTRLTDADLAAAIADYERDGATVLRQVVDRDRLARLGAAIDAMMVSGASGRDMSTAGGGRFFGDTSSWLHQPEFEAFLRQSGLAGIAGRIMRSREVRLFYDQLLVKEPRSAKRTPWHQDLPYWPVSGEQILSLWVAVDAASPDNGVVTYAKGSHRWNRFFPMESFTDGLSLEGSASRAGRSTTIPMPTAGAAWPTSAATPRATSSSPGRSSRATSSSIIR